MQVPETELNSMYDLLDSKGSEYWNEYIQSKVSLLMPNLKIQLKPEILESAKNQILILASDQVKKWQSEIIDEIKKDTTLTLSRLFITIKKFSENLTEKSFLIKKAIYENQYTNLQLMNLIFKYLPKEIKNQFSNENPAKPSDIPKLESQIPKIDNYTKEKNQIINNVNNLINTEKNKSDQLANKLTLDFLQLIYDKQRKIIIKIEEKKTSGMFGSKQPSQ